MGGIYMITIESVKWVRESWEVTLTIYEGVYHWDHYLMRITHLAFTEDLALQQAISSVAKDLVRRHMRQGSVPPHAMVLDWARASRLCEPEALETQAMCRTIEDRLTEVGGGISNHF